MNQQYGKAEKLKHRKQIERLFADGKALGQYPVRLFYIAIRPEDAQTPIAIGVSVSKRNFKNAVDRNKIKRMLREAYRKNKYLVSKLDNQPYWLMLVYVGKEIPKLKPLEQAVINVFKKLKRLEK